MSRNEQTGIFTRILATLDMLWLAGIVVYGVLQALGLVPPLSAGSYVFAALLGIGAAAVLFQQRH